MSLQSLPDIVGMLILMGVLGWLRTKHEDERVDLWLLGLFFILVEAVAVSIFRGAPLFHELTHVVALDAYLLAGVTFGWAARQDMLPGASHLPFFFLPAVPLFVLTTLYGLDLKDTRPYLYTAVASLAIGLLYILTVVRKDPRFQVTLSAIHLAIWLPMVVLASHGALRWLVYWGLTCLYLLVALSFRCRVRRGNIGGVVIVAGFVIWAMCFLVHPIVRGLPVYDAVVGQIWNMQKFLVILGMLLTLLEDETERRKGEAMHDVLTGLPNRRLFDDRLNQALERSLRSGKSIALFILDLDGFKLINDSQGHSIGDLVLQKTAMALQSKVRSSDTLARCGGDEFCIIINDLTRRMDCDRIAASLTAALAAVTVSPLPHTVLTGSIGYAMFPEDAGDVVDLYGLADSRMYEHKRAGTRLSFPERDLARADEFTERRGKVLS